MILYIGIYLILFFLVFFDFFFAKKESKVLLYAFVCLCMILLSGLRWRTGADWLPYQFFFTHFNPDKVFFWSAFEPGYTVLTYFVHIFSDSYTAFLLLFAFLTIGFRVVFLYKNTNSIFLGLLLYWGSTLADIVAVRQSLAISIALLSISYITKKKPVPFVITILIAMQIHISSFIFLAAYPIYNMKWSTKSKLIWLILSIALGISGIFPHFLQWLMSVSLPGNLARLSEKAEAYEKLGNTQTFGANKVLVLITGITKRAIIIPLLLYYDKKIIENKKNYSGLLNLFIFGNIIYFFVVDYLSVQRLAAYFYPLEIVLLCMIFDNSRKKIIWFCVFAFYALFKMVFVLQGSSDYIIPYYNIFQNEFYRDKRIGNFQEV